MFGTALTGGQRLQSIKFTLPKGFRFKTRKADVKRYVKVKITGAAQDQAVEDQPECGGQRRAATHRRDRQREGKGVTLPKSRKYRSGLKRGTKLKVRVRMVLVGGKVSTSTLTVKVK